MQSNRKSVWRRTRAVIRKYPDLTPDQRAAVADALRRTEQLADGAWRVRVVGMTLMKRSHTVDGAALECHVSRSTALRWTGAFILAVAKNLKWI